MKISLYPQKISSIIKSEIQVHAYRNILNSIRTKEEHVWRIKNQHNF